MNIIPEDDTVNICYAVDDNFVDLCCVSIYSIIRRKDPDTKLMFYILGDNITKTEHFSIFSGIENVGIVVTSCDARETIKPGYIYDRTGFATYLRMVIPRLHLFDKLHRILYIDADVFAKRDIYNLYHYELDGYAIGMVQDAAGVHCSAIGEYPWDNYEHKDWFCNAGLILMDLDKLRASDYPEKWIAEAKLVKDEHHNDQTIINKVCHYDCKLLPPTFQMPYHNLVRFPGKLWDYIYQWNRFYGTKYKSIEELVKSCYFWHFYEDKVKLAQIYPGIRYLLEFFMKDLDDFKKVGFVKPWKPEDDAPLFVDFSKYE